MKEATIVGGRAMRNRGPKKSVADRIVERLQEFTEALESGRPIGKEFTCRRVQIDLSPHPYGPDRVRATRLRLGASQAVFAMLLGVSARTVRSWEQGSNSPSDIACRFMDEIDRDPRYWRKRLREAAVLK